MYTLNISNLMKVSNMSTMIICGSYMFEFSVSNDMKKKDIIKEVLVGKVAAHLCLTLIVKEMKINVEHGRVVKHYISYLG
jgi:hypothetical protein